MTKTNEVEELRAKVAQLEERLEKYDAERAAYTVIALEHGTEILEAVYFAAITQGIPRLDANQGTARSRATRWAKGRSGDKIPTVLKCRIMPIEMTEKVGNKWPRKKVKKQKK